MKCKWLKYLTLDGGIPFQDVTYGSVKDVTFHFLDETRGEDCQWKIAMETANARQCLVESVRELWEAEFGVELQINVVQPAL